MAPSNPRRLCLRKLFKLPAALLAVSRLAAELAEATGEPFNCSQKLTNFLLSFPSGCAAVLRSQRNLFFVFVVLPYPFFQTVNIPGWLAC